MLTEEQIKNLKPGDPLIIQGTFERIYDDGDICVRVKETDTFSDDVVTGTKYIHPSCISLPSESRIKMFYSTVIPEEYPKYDPCRRFRKGDEVEYLPKDGRELFEAKRLLAQRLTVVENEHEEYNRVAVKAQNGDVLSVPFYYLKLVTPVEEMEPYEVTESSDYYGVDKDDLEVEAAIFWKKSHPHAKAAAEAECARLNAEYRKEMKK